MNTKEQIKKQILKKANELMNLIEENGYNTKFRNSDTEMYSFEIHYHKSIDNSLAINNFLNGWEIKGNRDFKASNVIADILGKYMTYDNMVKLQEDLEKAVVAPEYWYENMEKENAELQSRIDELEEKYE